MTMTISARALTRVIGRTTTVRHRGGLGGHRNTVLLGGHAGDDLAYVRATDLDLDLTFEIDALGDLHPVVLKAAATARILGTLGDTFVKIENHDGGVLVRHDRGSIVLGAAGSPMDFPSPVVDGEVWRVGRDAARAIRQAATAASLDEYRPILCGVLIDKGTALDAPRAVGTDSYRLMVAPFDGDRPPSTFLLPARAAAWLPLEATMTVDTSRGGRVAWTSPGMRVVSRTIDGQFPNYRQLVPTSHPTNVVVTSAALAAALTRCVAVLGDDPTPMRAEFGESTMFLNRATPSPLVAEGSAADAVTETIPYAEGFTPQVHPGLDVVAFNPTLMLSCVRALRSETVTLGVTDARKPASISTGDTFALLMPVRLS